MNTIVHTISDKLASPLEILKRRGVPVDRLLQHNPQYIHPPVQMIEQKIQNTNHHYHESHMEMTGRVENFNHHQIKDEIDHSCEAVPSANMTRYKQLFHSIPLYIERNVLITEKMLDQARQLAWVLVGLANHVFKIPIETLHLYRDIDGGKTKSILLNI